MTFGYNYFKKIGSFKSFLITKFSWFPNFSSKSPYFRQAGNTYLNLVSGSLLMRPFSSVFTRSVTARARALGDSRSILVLKEMQFFTPHASNDGSRLESEILKNASTTGFIGLRCDLER